MKRIGFIDYYLDEFHALNYPKWLSDASGGAVQVCYAYAQMDKPGGKTNDTICKELGIELLSTVEEIVEKSDCLVVLSPDHPEHHAHLAALPLASGKPTYIDKTFATDRDMALLIIKMAHDGGSPFFSTSALRYAKEYSEVEKRGIEAIVSRGPGEFETYAIHQLEPIICMMGAAVEKIMYVGAPATPSFVLKFSGGRVATMMQLGWACDFSIAINYENDQAVVIQGASDYYPRFIAQLADFFLTGIPKVPADDTLQIITILEYGKMAMKSPDTWIALPQI